MDFWICWLKKDLLQRNRGDREEEKSAENESFWQILCFQDNIGAFGKTVVCSYRIAVGKIALTGIVDIVMVGCLYKKGKFHERKRHRLRKCVMEDEKRFLFFTIFYCINLLLEMNN